MLMQSPMPFFSKSRMEKPLLPTSLMSITDIDNCELSYQVIEEAARISREGWLFVQQEAEHLIASAAE
ncbi:hypothetical protein [Caballeronia sp. LZ032]|uniref:hypothetical protein n=1 Tax=Caballeronia sp. LZ032 TaxID=3038565 RepID=UPI00286534A7|nr:hypothetical protein [Caballeronia sp. LZ032]MDR5876662.1 hypothetical protein [Caballeronia sp. LZ032]